jgi:hypothetical protein
MCLDTPYPPPSYVLAGYIGLLCLRFLIFGERREEEEVMNHGEEIYLNSVQNYHKMTPKETPKEAMEQSYSNPEAHRLQRW